MKPILSQRSLVALSLFVVLAACNKEKTDAAPAKTAAVTDVATVTPTAASVAPIAQVVPDVPTASAGSGLARSALDGKEPDAGWTGTQLSVNKLSFTRPSEWASKNGDFTVAALTDGSNGIAAGKYPDGASGANLRDAAAKALGLVECSWGATDSIKLGKDKLTAEAADGACKREGKAAKAIFVATSGKDMNVLAVGSWDEGKDEKGVLNTLRSAKGAVTGTGGDPSGIAACCAAIRQNMGSAPLQYQGMYAAAAGACQSAIGNPQGKQALGSVRAMLTMAGVPAACR